jgi:hypothetical protein
MPTRKKPNVWFPVDLPLFRIIVLTHFPVMDGTRDVQRHFDNRHIEQVCQARVTTVRFGRKLIDSVGQIVWLRRPLGKNLCGLNLVPDVV